MNTKGLTILLAFFIILTTVQAAKVLDEHSVELTPGENYTFQLEDYSYTKIKVYEGNTLTLHIGESTNIFMIKTINSDGLVTVSVNTNGTPKDFLLVFGGQPTQIQILDKTPVVYLENQIFHSNPDKKLQYAVLKFTVPLIQKVNAQDLKNRKAVSANSSLPPTTSSQKDPYLKYFIAAIIILLIIIIILGPREKAKEPQARPPPVEPKKEENAEEKPKQKRISKKQPKVEETDEEE